MLMDLMSTYTKEEKNMTIVVIKSPKFLTPVLKRIFKIKKNR